MHERVSVSPLLMSCLLLPSHINLQNTFPFCTNPIRRTNILSRLPSNFGETGIGFSTILSFRVSNLIVWTVSPNRLQQHNQTLVNSFIQTAMPFFFFNTLTNVHDNASFTTKTIRLHTNINSFHNFKGYGSLVST